MRLRRLDLTRYGKFTDHSIDFGPAKPGAPDLHIVYGLNEAGKSTALAAYLDLIFGIEERSRFNFLHPYPSMQIGGLLEFSGETHELVRVKQRTGSLLDKSGQPLNEALLSVPLAGLTRDAYQTMFSLDDRTLEEGGNAIIQSKGDLGELLFSASAGLADLSSMLEAIRSKAEEIYKQRGRTTDIAELKKQLALLKADRDAVDTLASAHSALVAALAQAETTYESAIREQAETKAQLDGLTRLLRAAPLASEHHGLVQALAAIGELPTPPVDWASELPKLLTRSTELRTQIATTGEDLKRLDGEIAEIIVDEKLLALSSQIDALATGMDRFTTAESDLPRRRETLIEHEAVIAAILRALDEENHPDPRQLLLTAPVVGELRDLIEARSGVDAQLTTAERELALARENVEIASAEKDAIGTGAAPSASAGLAGIEAALSTMRRSNHQARLHLAERALPQFSRRYHAALDSLLPWRGEGNALRSLTLPTQRQIDLWRTRTIGLEARRNEHSGKLHEFKTREQEETARISAIRAQTGRIDDTEANRLRAARDAAWTAHLQQLEQASAAAFVQALRDDDAIGTARLANAQALADLRALEQALAVTKARLGAQEEELARTDADLKALRAEVEAALPAGMTPSSAEILILLEALESWTRRRDEAIVAWDALAETQDDLANAKADLDRDIAMLAEALTLSGHENVEDLSANALMQAAEAALTQGSARQASAATAEKTLRDRERDLQARERDFKQAQASAQQWQTAWAAALEKTWFTADGAGAVRETLDALADLPAALNQRDELLRRIDTMQRDQENFAESLDALMDEIGEPLDPSRLVETARHLAERREAADRARRLLEQKTRERDRLAAILRSISNDLESLSARTGEMTSFFAVELLDEVAPALEQAAERARLQQRVQALETRIVEEMRSLDLATALEKLAGIDLAPTERDAAETATRLNDLEERRLQLFAERSRAADRLQAIGGDDAVARIEARRRTVLLEIEDKAMTYLRLRTGALVAEKALRVYREKHRSSMMNRASEAFALITRGDYTGLTARPEKDRETLVGLPRQGGSKLASDMSKGTQFQLYLALRLAGYQEFALARPSVPFIADDIMETFDEPRSEEVFRLLGEMSKIGQVIYLTHHRHLCDMAKAVVPGVQVHSISG